MDRLGQTHPLLDNINIDVSFLFAENLFPNHRNFTVVMANLMFTIDDFGNKVKAYSRLLRYIGGCRVSMTGELLDDCIYEWGNTTDDFYVTTHEGNTHCKS